MPHKDEGKKASLRQGGGTLQMASKGTLPKDNKDPRNNEMGTGSRRR